MKAFQNWLLNNNVEKLAAVNHYEVFRFRCAIGIGVIYKDRLGNHSCTGAAVSAAMHFIGQGRSNVRWEGNAPKPRSSKSERKRLALVRTLLERDGDRCFYCGEALPTDDKAKTLEHLLSRGHGGDDNINNLVLTDQPCNSLAANLSIAEKVALRDRLRRRHWALREAPFRFSDLNDDTLYIV